MSALVLGATGLCGGGFLKEAEKTGKFNTIVTLTRRALPKSDSIATQIVEPDNSKWSHLIPENTKYLFTGLSMTSYALGGFDNQYKIDHDLNLELAKAAKAKGCSTIVVVSSDRASLDSRFSYMRMKGEIERDIVALDFDHTIILRPGILLGERDPQTAHKSFTHDAMRMIGGMFYRSRLAWLAEYPIYGDEVGKVGVHLALNKDGEKVQILESKEILDIAAGLSK
ncbi:hypothetical protein NCAS_0E02080 [Naumovozyma castellii]|uniref:Protein FMP52, mitochondrial n=1 Tax=Naumovozyma castellii TaxID=27288 RepID=G0VFL1_NAUCA|nr:hypothetical protein NCAS_0E02080 [Naumovozyma castellii CBS 4309]CCC70278.1 hypothetical protein NCAS_0E02080 [Naumovozyma castellii CBS 4309]